tara:strand:+ start:327 stop:1067 length:741 start_codon:yes stop_codon:yes gene_type:complete
LSLSILAKAKPEDIRIYPYPHIVIRNAIDEPLYNQLAKEYPSIEEIWKKDTGPNNKLLSNTRYQVSSNTPLESTLWNIFVNYHTSPEFYREVINLFGGHIEDIHGILAPADLSSGKRRSGAMFSESLSGETDVGLDCQVGMNSPVFEQSRVIGMHVDQPNKIFVGMLYMRDEQDDSLGGHLQIYRHKHNHEKNMDINNMEIHNTIEYDRNTVVFFINSSYSIHAVTLRNPTPHRRRLVNFIGEVYK